MYFNPENYQSVTLPAEGSMSFYVLRLRGSDVRFSIHDPYNMDEGIPVDAVELDLAMRAVVAGEYPAAYIMPEKGTPEFIALEKEAIAALEAAHDGYPWFYPMEPDTLYRMAELWGQRLILNAGKEAATSGASSSIGDLCPELAGLFSK